MPSLQSPPPLSNQDTYTSWPGGIDPMARVYARGGAKRRSVTRRNTRRRRSTTRRNSRR